MGLVVACTTIASVATWGVMAIEEIAHKIINVGALLLLAAAAIVAVQGFARLAGERLNLGGSGRPAWGRRLKALRCDPVRFGLLFELIFVNVVVTAPGVYVAFNLETYRQPAFLEVERAIAVGHWHVLATLSAVIALLLVVDRLGCGGSCASPSAGGCWLVPLWPLCLSSSICFASRARRWRGRHPSLMQVLPSSS